MEVSTYPVLSVTVVFIKQLANLILYFKKLGTNGLNYNNFLFLGRSLLSVNLNRLLVAFCLLELKLKKYNCYCHQGRTKNEEIAKNLWQNKSVVSRTIKIFRDRKSGR